MTGNGHNTLEELAAFAMQSLPGEEAASIKAHLDSCPECRASLNGQSTVDGLLRV